jgi:putative GTP pyrophosphokinase
MSANVPSSNQVKKAGSTVRKFYRGECEVDAALEAVNRIEAWRRAHYTPLVTANNGLRSRARTAGVTAEVTQRLKRRQTILEKVQREPTLDLSRMQDIGGCRAVVETIDDLRRLEERVKNGRVPVVGGADYVKNPRRSGYRGVHVIVQYQGRQIEIQLRTATMHTWALAAENYSQLLDLNLKQDGDHPVQLFLATASEMMALHETFQEIPDELQALHQQRRLDALPLLP